MEYPLPIAQLIDSFSKLPGIGQKTAARLAFYVLEMPESEVTQFAQGLINVKRDLTKCHICGMISDTDPCAICQDETRDPSTILVVEDVRDVMAMERIREYNGLYHVLNGVMSPLTGTGPEDLTIPQLIQRLQDERVEEVILATNATAEGEATAVYLSRLIKPAGIKVTRLAHGLSVGSDIEYADELTLFRAVEGRREI